MTTKAIQENSMPPDPLVSSEVDLRDFTFMPLDVVRLRDSDLAAMVSGEAFRAAVLLWCAAWHQVPASSLSNDDVALARLAGFGRDTKGWRKVKTDALRGFVECTDGRLYHRVIAEKANEAWKAKLEQRVRTAAATEARLARLAAAKAEKGSSRSEGRDEQRNDKRYDPRNVDRNDKAHDPRNEDRNEDRHDPRYVVQGKGQGRDREGIGKKEKDAAAARATQSPFEMACRKAVEPEPVMLALDFHMIEALAEEGITQNDIRTGIAEALERRSDPRKRYRNWSQLTGWCRTAAQNRLANTPRPAAGAENMASTEPRFDFGGGYTAPYSVIRSVWAKRNWLPDWGPKPDDPGCWISKNVLDEIMGHAAA